MISPQAFVDPSAKLGNNVTVYPFAYIEADTEIGDNCVIYPFASIMKGTRLGSGNVIHQGAVLAAEPMDFDFTGEPSQLIVGNDNVFRENVVVNRATHSDGQTIIGSENYIMEGVHISHDTHIGNGCIFGYGSKIGGCVEISDNVIFYANVIAAPSTRVGRNAIIKSGARFTKDVPPYIIAHHYPIHYGGVDSYVLSQYGIGESNLRHISNAYRLVFNGKTSLQDCINQVKNQVKMDPEIEVIIQFLETSTNGLIGKDM